MERDNGIRRPRPDQGIRNGAPPDVSGIPGVRARCGSRLDEAAIVARARLDPAAFAPLYQAYLAPVYRYCYRRLGSREAAEDATSLVFERVLRSLAAFRGGSFRAWLFAIAHNTVADSYRRRGSDPPISEALDIVDPAPPPEQVALRLADQRRLLTTALALLPADQRQVIELRLERIPSVGRRGHPGPQPGGRASDAAPRHATPANAFGRPGR